MFENSLRKSFLTLNFDFKDEVHDPQCELWFALKKKKNIKREKNKTRSKPGI